MIGFTEVLHGERGAHVAFLIRDGAGLPGSYRNSGDIRTPQGESTGIIIRLKCYTCGYYVKYPSLNRKDGIVWIT